MIFYLLFRIIFVFVYMTIITQFKYNFKKTFLILLSFNMFLFLVCSTIYAFKGLAFLDIVFPLVVTIPAYISFLIASKQKGFKLLFSFLTVCNFGMLKTYIGILSYKATDDIYIRLMFEFIAFILILLLLIKFFRKPYLKILDTLDKEWGVLCAVPLLLAFQIYLLLMSANYTLQSITIILVTFIIMLVFYVVFYLNFKNINQYYQLKQSREVLQIQTEMQNKEYAAILDKINTIQIYRHDMRHQINIMNSFLDDNNVEETQKYLNKLNDNLNKTIIEKYCNNYVVNVILSTYINKAKAEDITVLSKIDIPERINIDNIELGLIFTNAIENAVIACKKIENSNERKINIICKDYYGQLYIQISNPFIGNIVFSGELPTSTEEDHGFGTRSIVSIVEKYKGTYSFTKESGFFKLSVILKYN